MEVTVFVTSEQVESVVDAGSPATPSLLKLNAVMPLLPYQHLAKDDGYFETEDPAHLHGEGTKYSEKL